MFQNLGDGTYNHSGYGDPRCDRVGRQHHLQDLYNDAAAKTGVENDGGLDVLMVARQWRPKGPTRRRRHRRAGNIAKNEDWPRGSPSTTATS
jgi:indolepyruvate ferredoxin oxidoreductase